MSDLDQLRTELSRIDSELLELIQRRQKAAQAIGALKQKSGLATRNFRQEREVIERARKVARDLGLSEGVAERLMLLLIDSSLTVQEQDRLVSVGQGGGQRVLVIGGNGKMGRWFVRFLESQGFSVEIADPNRQSVDHAWVADWRQVELDHDMIVVAAPLRVSAQILHELAERAPRGLIFDVGSLKSPLRSGLKALADAGCRVTSMHPMFGPDTEMLSGRHVIFTDVGNEDATAEVRSLFASTMAVQVEMDLESHDRLIAYILGLSHALNLAFLTALVESGEAAPKLAKLSSATFDKQLQVARQVAGENPHLYFEIQSLNDYGTESLSALLYAVERIRSVVRSGDENGFAAIMERGREYMTSRDVG